MPSYFVSLSQLFSIEAIPTNFFTLSEGDTVFDVIGVKDYFVETTLSGLYFRANLALNQSSVANHEIVASLPQFPDLGLILSDLGKLEIWFQTEFKLRLSVGSFKIRLPSHLLRPVQNAGNGTWEVDSSREYVEVKVDFTPFQDRLPVSAKQHPISLTIDRSGRIDIEYPFQESSDEIVVPIISLNGPAMLAESGIVFEAREIVFDLNPEDPTLSFGEAFLKFPPNLFGSIVLPELKFENASLSQRGFSGSVIANWPLVYENDKFVYRLDGEIRDADLFTLKGGLQCISLAFFENRIIASAITGGLIIPYFEKPINIGLNIISNGNFSATLVGVGNEGINLTKEELIALNIQILTIAKDGELYSVVISGQLEPLLMASSGLQMPKLDVNDLYIDTEGTIKLREAWLDLKNLTTLDLWGFKFELSRLGLGYEELNDYLWVDLSGSLRLLPQIPVGLGVEGFRLTWPRDLSPVFEQHGNSPLDLALAIADQIQVNFGGIYLFYGIPTAVEFEGLIRFFKDAQVVGFAGDMALRVPSAGFAAEAGLMIGINFENPPYPFLYLYFGVELPSGIPLGQSGLALKGAIGLFGLNVAPDKTPDQNWYYDWYKRNPIGAYQTNKWRNERDALALGVGVTITTTDGYIKGTRGLLVLAVPGPILIIEGRALILDGLKPNADPPLRALAIFDGKQQIAQFNIEAKAEVIKDMLEAYGTLEAFFDFKDITNWHLYLGQDQPNDRRIQANVLKYLDAYLFKADAYLMLDMVGSQTLRSRMGVFIGFKPKVPPIGPVNVVFDATLSGDGVATILPEQFSGAINLSANVELSAFGFGLQMTANADVLTEGPEPLRVETNVEIHAEIPLPPLQINEDLKLEVSPVEVDGELHFVWQSPEPPTITPPLEGVTVTSRFEPGGSALEMHEKSSVSSDRTLADSSPVVPLDATPLVMFRQEMNQSSNSNNPDSPGLFARHPDGLLKFYDIGLMRFIPDLVKVELFEHEKNRPWTDTSADWQLIASSDKNRNLPLPGTWLADSDPQQPAIPAARRLQLWADNPLTHTQTALGHGYGLFLNIARPTKPLAESILDDYPQLMVCEYGTPETVCVDFNDAENTKVPSDAFWNYQGLQIKSDNSITLVPEAANQVCLNISQNNSSEIRFPVAVSQVKIRLCKPALAPEEVLTKRRAKTLDEIDQIRIEAANQGTTPDFNACHYKVNHRPPSFQSQEWTIETLYVTAGFHCLEIKGKVEYSIAEICYITAEEAQRVRRANQQCEDNQRDFPLSPIKPGCHYRLEISTQLKSDLNLESLPFPINSLLGEALEKMYDFIADQVYGKYGFINSTTTDVAFFQTEGPPHNLSRYIKWTNPEHQSTRVFRGDDFSIRFLRSNLRQMFNEQSAYPLKIALRDAEGHLISKYRTSWNKAQNATLFAEESAWATHRETKLNWPAPPTPQDDLLEASSIITTPTLNPNARYEMLVMGGNGGEELPLEWDLQSAGWSEQNGQIQRGASDQEAVYAGDPTWRDIEFSVEVKAESGQEVGLFVRVNETTDSQISYPIWQAYRVVLKPNPPTGLGEARLELIRQTDSEGTVSSRILARRTINIPLSEWLRLKVSVIGDSLQVWLFNLRVFTANLSQPILLNPRPRSSINIISSIFPPSALPGSSRSNLTNISRPPARRPPIDLPITPIGLPQKPILLGRVGLYSEGNQAFFRQVQVYSSILHSVTFTTSAFLSFHHLISSYSGNAVALELAEKPTLSIPPTSSQLAFALWQWHVDQIDFKFELLDGGRETLEASRLNLRNAKAAHDEAFRAIAQAYSSQLLYQPFADGIELYVLKTSSNGSVSGAIAFWLRSPETLDLWMDVRDINSISTHVGRTRLKLERKQENTSWRTIDFRLFHDSDSNQIIFLPDNNEAWTTGIYQLTFSYYQDHGDEDSLNNHRYDRPVEKQSGASQAATPYLLSWSLQ
jgi:hypothetical protein